MRSRSLLLRAGLFAAFALAVYALAVPRLETLALEAWHAQVVKRLARSKSALAEGGAFRLGLYRPELPYHYRTVYEVEDSLDAAVSIISFYQAWGGGEEHRLNRTVLDNIARGGFTPMITWEPWVSAFPDRLGQMPEKSLALVADGEFDAYVRAWAREAVRFGKPMLMRYAHEFSNPWYSWSTRFGNDKEIFVRAWRHVHGIFQEEGARNVAFVWNPYQAADTAFYPGDGYVDWIGLDVFNYGPVVENGYWMDFFTLLHGLYGSVKGYGKPILIAEAGTVSEGGNKAEWYAEMFRNLAAGSFPLVKALVVFDNPSSKAPNGIPVDLALTTDSLAYGAIRATGALKSLGVAPRPAR